jgi:hypothetical protein
MVRFPSCQRRVLFAGKFLESGCGLRIQFFLKALLGPLLSDAYEINHAGKILISMQPYFIFFTVVDSNFKPW